MRILFDIVHPAHVHFYRHVIRELEARGHQTLVVGRDKEVTRQLLTAYAIPHTSVGWAGRKSWPSQLHELLHRDWTLWRLAREFRAEVICARNPAGMHAARLAGCTGIYDSDDGFQAGIQFRLALPFAHVVTTPACLPERLGRKHRPYPGYKQSAYLHPDHFTPDPRVLGELGVSPGEPFFLVRFVAMHATHDSGEAGLDQAAKEAVIAQLQDRGRVFLSSEGALPEAWQPLQLPIPPHRLHHALAFATLLVGDSQTMAAEAAMLGTPAIRVSTFAGRLAYLEEMEHRYGLLRSFHPRQGREMLELLQQWLALPDPRAMVSAGRGRMLAETVNVANWYVRLIEEQA